jgi:hypothetical protein
MVTLLKTKTITSFCTPLIICKEVVVDRLEQLTNGLGFRHSYPSWGSVYVFIIGVAILF